MSGEFEVNQHHTKQGIGQITNFNATPNNLTKDMISNICQKQCLKTNASPMVWNWQVFRMIFLYFML